jgi:hypothetical protein
VPVAVAPQDQAPPLAAFDAEQPLVVPPPPAQGSSKHISASGQGRRIWVDIHSSIEVKFKEVRNTALLLLRSSADSKHTDTAPVLQVLRQQGLDYKTWRANMQQRRAQQDTAAGAQVRAFKQQMRKQAAVVHCCGSQQTTQHGTQHSYVLCTAVGCIACPAATLLDLLCWRVEVRLVLCSISFVLQGGDGRRHGLSAAGVYQRTQGMYEVKHS